MEQIVEFTVPTTTTTRTEPVQDAATSRAQQQQQQQHHSNHEEEEEEENVAEKDSISNMTNNHKTNRLCQYLSTEEKSMVSNILCHVRAERWGELLELLQELSVTTSSTSTTVTSTPATTTTTTTTTVLDRILSLENMYEANTTEERMTTTEEEEDAEADDGGDSLLSILCTYPSVPIEIIQFLLNEGKGREKLAATITSAVEAQQQQHHQATTTTPLHIVLQNIPERYDIVQELVSIVPDMINLRDIQNSYLKPIEILCQTIIMKEELVKYTRHHHGRQQQQRRDELSSSSSQPLENDIDANDDDLVESRLWECAHILADTAASISSSSSSSSALRTTVVVPSERKQQQHKRRRPMVHACLKAVDFPFALTERAMKRYPEQLRQPDDENGDLPLHIVAARCHCRRHREEDDEEDEEDDEDEDEEEDYMNQIISLYPKGASHFNFQQQLPLDIAIQTGHRTWNTGISSLLEVYPAGLVLLGGQGQDEHHHQQQPKLSALPLNCYSFVLYQMVKEQRWNMLYGIFQSKPELFFSTTATTPSTSRTKKTTTKSGGGES